MHKTKITKGKRYLDNPCNKRQPPRKRAKYNEPRKGKKKESAMTQCLQKQSQALEDYYNTKKTQNESVTVFSAWSYTFDAKLKERGNFAINYLHDFGTTLMHSRDVGLHTPMPWCYLKVGYVVGKLPNVDDEESKDWDKNNDDDHSNIIDSLSAYLYPNRNNNNYVKTKEHQLHERHLWFDLIIDTHIENKHRAYSAFCDNNKFWNNVYHLNNKKGKECVVIKGLYPSSTIVVCLTGSIKINKFENKKQQKNTTIKSGEGIAILTPDIPKITIILQPKSSMIAAGFCKYETEKFDIKNGYTLLLKNCV